MNDPVENQRSNRLPHRRARFVASSVPAAQHHHESPHHAARFSNGTARKYAAAAADKLVPAALK
jgi:hypothetical protein